MGKENWLTFRLDGNDCLPPVSGGYLIIFKNDKELSVISVPSPILSANRHRDSVIENNDSFSDDEGNDYSVSVWSSNVGVDWQVDVSAPCDIRDQLKVEYRANEF